jgi:hypothetical protein
MPMVAPPTWRESNQPSLQEPQGGSRPSSKTRFWIQITRTDTHQNALKRTPIGVSVGVKIASGPLRPVPLASQPRVLGSARKPGRQPNKATGPRE